MRSRLWLCAALILCALLLVGCGRAPDMNSNATATTTVTPPAASPSPK